MKADRVGCKSKKRVILSAAEGSPKGRVESGVADRAVGESRNVEPIKGEIHHVTVGDASCLRSKCKYEWKVESGE